MSGQTVEFDHRGRAIDALRLVLPEVCESPIEARLIVALVINAPKNLYIDVDDPSFPLDHRSRAHVVIVPQEEIGPYRVDCAISSRYVSIRAVVECDGHDFHEKTKEQAARDKKRDRYLTSEGYMIFRFTGSEIYRDARACAKEVWAAIAKRTCNQ